MNIDEDGLAAEGEGDVTLSGEADLTFNEGDKVYLCITQDAGYHTYDNIKIEYKGEATPPATETAPAPDDDLVLNDTFDVSGDALGYTVYDSANTGAVITVEGSLGVNFGEGEYGWNPSNGVRKDITSLVKSGSKYAVSADIHSTYWNNANAKLFFEIVSGNAATIVNIDEDGLAVEGEGDVTLSGEADLTFNEGDKVYLCITQDAGYHSYDNIKIEYKGEVELEPDDGSVMNDTFDVGGDTSGYTVYDSANTGAEVTADGNTLGVKFGDGVYGWNETNGVRKDITSLVESGSKYEVSADVYSSWWGGVSAKLFVEIVSGSTTSIVDIDSEVLDVEGEGTVSLSGTANLTFNEGDKVYLCITQAAGYQTYDNIKMVYAGAADPEPQETDAPPAGSESPAPTLAPIEDPIFVDDFSSAEQAASYSLYDGTNTTAGAGISTDNGELVASMGTEGWNASNGIRRDITELVKQYISGVTFGVQLKLTAFWGDGNDASASVFFETVSESGTKTVTEIGTMLPTDGTEAASMRGSAQLSYSEGDTIYLCVTQLSGNHRYDDVAMWLENTYGDGIIPLTSGTRYAGTYFPASADAIFSNTFSGDAAAEMEAYSPYNDVAYVTAEPRDGGAFFEFPEGGTTMRGVAVDITDAIENNIPNGGQVRVSCKMLPWWWWGSASIKIRNGGTITDAATYTANTGDPGGVWATIEETIDLPHTPGDKVELIIAMDSSSATGITIDDVKVELPYSDVTVRDVAVSDEAKLAEVTTVSLVYGGEYVTETSVEWGAPEPGTNVVYGTTGIPGITARAIITDSALKVRVAPNGVTTEETALEYGKAVTAEEGDELAFMLDSMEGMHLIGTAAGAVPAEGVPETTAKMIVRDNGNGITIEGVAPEAANNDKVIIVTDEDGNIADAVYVRISADGGYSAETGALPTGNYTAVMTDTGITADFSYATESEFETLRDEINSGSAASLLEDDINRMILGASSYDQLDKLSSADKSAVYGEFESELGDKSRAEAAELFDAIVTVKAASDEVSEPEWSELLERSSETLGIKDMPIYEQYKAMDSDDRNSAKSKVYSLNISSPDEFADAFAGAVLNTRLVNAGQYSNVQAILKENAALFEGTGTDVNGISSSEARYIINNINSSDITIDAIAALIDEAEKEAASSTGSSGGSGGGGGAGGGGGTASGGSNSVPGSSIGLNINTETGQIGSGITSGGNVETQTPLFTDLSGYGWAETAVYYLADRQVINGYGDGTFRPGENVTREAFVKMLVEVFDIPMNGSSVSFEDVPADRWSHAYVCAAAEAGIVTGVSESEFAPDANITRQDAAVMIYRALAYKGIAAAAGELSFTDSELIADYAAEAVSALSASGIINGMDDGSFAPTGITSRAQAAVMLYRVADTMM